MDSAIYYHLYGKKLFIREDTNTARVKHVTWTWRIHNDLKNLLSRQRFEQIGISCFSRFGWVDGWIREASNVAKAWVSPMTWFCPSSSSVCYHRVKTTRDGEIVKVIRFTSTSYLVATGRGGGRESNGGFVTSTVVVCMFYGLASGETVWLLRLRRTRASLT